VEVDDGLLHIYSADEAVHAFNFLNIPLKDYSVNDGDLFAAEDQLRWAIRFTLEPEKYRNGYNGGYGHGDNDIFEIPKFTLSGSQLTIREVLNRITLAQGNALWVATLNNEDFKGAKPFWRKKRAEGEPLPVTSRWHFYPLAGINELATEQVVVELLIDGHMDQRMSVIPVMSEYGLRGSEGGGGGGGSSDGFSYGYGASIEKLEKDSVTLSVHLSVQQPGEAELKFDESILVRRGRVLELHPAPRVRIKTYFEARNKTLD
jgi:hypothetical protein